MLYVNDRFMFKTNVVYTGFTIHEISEVDRQNETATIDMSIWFRYRGEFSPEDLEIANVAESIKLDNLEESKENEDIRYRRYRVKETFKLNFTSEDRAYNNHIAGITFRHRILNRNNLSYVVDVLGMPTGQALLGELQQRRVVRAGSGWLIENAWVSQRVVRERGNGAPQYIGMSGEQPYYSTITLGVLLKPETIVARDIISDEYFIYIAIFGLIGSLVALLMEVRQVGQYWMFHSWLLRIVFWPLFLLAIGNLVIDWSFSHWTPSTTRAIVTFYDSWWWVMIARLVDLTIRRFVWIPLERRAGRQIPNVMKLLATFVLFAFATAGVTAFVFNQTLTSLLATSGVLAMVIGFAIQANIANVFSGIVLNVERPFQVGDYIKVDNVFGRVSDITWRTVRIESYEGPMVSMTNAKVSESKVENHNQVPKGLRMMLDFQTPAEIDPEQIQALVQAVIDDADYVMGKGHPRGTHDLQYQGVQNINGQWVANYRIMFKVKNFLEKIRARGAFYLALRQRFVEQEIPLLPAKNTFVTTLEKSSVAEEGATAG